MPRFVQLKGEGRDAWVNLDLLTMVCSSGSGAVVYCVGDSDGFYLDLSATDVMAAVDQAIAHDVERG